MEKLQSRLLVLLRRLRLSDELHAEYVETITSAETPLDLGLVVAEFMDRAGDDLDALAVGFQSSGAATEAARVRAEARMAHAPLDAVAARRERVAPALEGEAQP